MSLAYLRIWLPAEESSCDMSFLVFSYSFTGHGLSLYLYRVSSEGSKCEGEIVVRGVGVLEMC